MPETDPRFQRAIEAIDAANATDPVEVVVDGVTRPKELAHADVVERWLRRVDPGAGDLQLIAARAHHLRRWVAPRHDYPEGRAGYLRWRADHKKRQAAEVAELLRGAGYGDAEVGVVAGIVAKQGLGRDPLVQAHEDALCLAFLELQADDLTAQLGFDHMVEVVRKTARKMSPRALELAGEVTLGSDAGAALAAAVADPSGG